VWTRQERQSEEKEKKKETKKGEHNRQNMTWCFDF
jgi:hypothetical protein